MHPQQYRTAQDGRSQPAPEQASRPPPAAPVPGSQLAGTWAPGTRLAAARKRLAAPPGPPGTPSEQRAAADLRKQLEAVRLGAQGAASWLESSGHYAQLINRDGFVPVTARFDAQDLAFLGSAREQLLGFAELGLRLIELHQPLDAGGITTDPASPILRCRSCMWRWPCPTFRTMAEVVDELQPPAPG